MPAASWGSKISASAEARASSSCSGDGRCCRVQHRQRRTCRRARSRRSRGRAEAGVVAVTAAIRAAAADMAAAAPAKAARTALSLGCRLRGTAPPDVTRKAAFSLILGEVGICVWRISHICVHASGWVVGGWEIVDRWTGAGAGCTAAALAAAKRL